jgi:hypothetical protein
MLINEYILTGTENVGRECKVHPRTGHQGPEGEYNYSSTLSLTSAVDWG